MKNKRTIFMFQADWPEGSIRRWFYTEQW